ncbi:glycosyl transferase group 1 [Fibrella aestuarina BUZ 2]|uniref:Glycosyl transferase group 1 n=1 Tax=Fibrella aestuarina BUZ 2 TaxID=1166018 RepID=I0K644_9BACT|nr:glycosyltransferase family 1 protein [Fibrella aestuarina]CCG99597.1 glycosyl transferase group 1 [Fibrella aestuarina BUZ 2]
MTISILFRQKGAGFSIEGVFGLLATYLRTQHAVTVCETHVPNMVIRPGALWQNLRVARRQRADVYHISGDVHYLALALPPRRTVLTIHDCISLDRERQRGNRWRYYALWLLFYYLPMHRVARITTVSDKSRRELIRHMGPLAERVTVIPNPCNPRFQPSPNVFNETNPTLLHIENGEHKNLARLALALQGIRCKLLIIGPLTPERAAQLAALGIVYEQRVNLTDEQMVAAYKACDMLVFVSLYEGFGLPVLEANATGRVVLTSAIDPLRDVAGEAALLVDPTSVAAIRAGVQRLMTDAALRQRLITAGYQNVVRYKAETVAAHYMAVYQSVIS